MCRDIPGLEAPFLLSCSIEAIKHPRADIIARIGNVNIFCMRMYKYAVRYFYLTVRAIGNKITGYDFMGLSIDDGVCNFIVVRYVAPLYTAGIQRIADNTIIAWRNIYCIGNFLLIPVQEKQSGGMTLVIPPGADPQISPFVGFNVV